MPTTMTGQVADFQIERMDDVEVEVHFIPSGPTTHNAGRILATKRITVTPEAWGGFEVSLAETDNMDPPRWYRIKITWLDDEGEFTEIDFPDWKLFVPTSGSPQRITDHLDTSGGNLGVGNALILWTGSSAPTIRRPGVFWLNTITQDITRWRND